MGKTEQRGISFRINAQIPAVLHLSDTDLCSILSNSRENAMPACQDIPDEENRMISCRVYIKNDKLCLDIRNNLRKSLSSTTASRSAVIQDMDWESKAFFPSLKSMAVYISFPSMMIPSSFRLPSDQIHRYTTGL